MWVPSALRILANRLGAALLLVAAMAVARSGDRAFAESGSASSADRPVTESADLVGGVNLFVARRGWHLDVGFAVDAAPESLQPLVRELPGARYVFLGFGDRRYLRAHHRLPAMLAALWPGRALILATGLIASPAQAFGAQQVIRLPISATQWLAAQRFIRRSLGERGATDIDTASDLDTVTLASDEVGPGPYEGSVYYSSSATYSAAHTCNTWVAEVLQSAGLPVRSKGVVFAGQVWGQVARLGGGDVGMSAGHKPAYAGQSE